LKKIAIVYRKNANLYKVMDVIVAIVLINCDLCGWVNIFAKIIKNMI